jgi:glutathione S-transferase
MSDALTLFTFDWVPEMPRGFVRDIRVRWLLEETGRPYRVETVPLRDKTPGHFARQPFGQVPFIRDGDLTLFESGAILLHLAKGTPLLPEGDDGARVMQWVIAALNSVEPWVTNWMIARLFRNDPALIEAAMPMMTLRLTQLQEALGDRDWLLPQGFTVADLLMADVLRIPDRDDQLAPFPGLAAYKARALARPAFARAYQDQMEHWQKAVS